MDKTINIWQTLPELWLERRGNGPLIEPPAAGLRPFQGRPLRTLRRHTEPVTQLMFAQVGLHT